MNPGSVLMVGIAEIKLRFVWSPRYLHDIHASEYNR